ncbi:hypothetical protein OF83DRAFT_1019709, partial [Amylostereum chailletii]
KPFNLETYKWHSAGDYPDSIPWIGTTDNGSTQMSELQHRRSKQDFLRTNKHNYITQITKQDARERLLLIVGKRLVAHVKKRDIQRARNRREKHSATKVSERLPPTNPTCHYHISDKATSRFNLGAWLSAHEGDPALTNFYNSLHDHILVQLLGLEFDDTRTFTDEERESVIIVQDELHKHQVLRVNYTTYDLRRQQDTVTPKRHADIMVLSPDDDGTKVPYWFACVLNILHVNVIYCRPSSTSKKAQRLDILWVWWFGLTTEPAMEGGWAKKQLHAVHFILQDEDSPFSFINPDQVVRAAHLVPAFKYGMTEQRLDPLIACKDEEKDMDWEMFYINMFVDRDMFMRFRGGGVGHLSTRHLNRELEDDGEQGEEEHDEEDEDKDGDEDEDEDEDEDGDNKDGDEDDGD